MVTKLKFRYRVRMLCSEHKEEWELTILEAAERFQRRTGRGPDAQPNRPTGHHQLWLVDALIGQPYGGVLLMDEYFT